MLTLPSRQSIGAEGTSQGAEFGDLMNEFTTGLVNGVTLVEIKQQDSALFSSVSKERSLCPAEHPAPFLAEPHSPNLVTCCS